MDGGGGEIVGSGNVPASPPPPPAAEVGWLGDFGWFLEEVNEEEVEFEESAVEEMMKMLEREISMPSPAAEAGRSYYQAPGFVTINGNEGMCWSSFSDYSSTVMAASMDTQGLPGVGGGSHIAGVPPVWVPPVVWGDEDDEWLEELISGAGFL